MTTLACEVVPDSIASSVLEVSLGQAITYCSCVGAAATLAEFIIQWNLRRETKIGMGHLVLVWRLVPHWRFSFMCANLVYYRDKARLNHKSENADARRGEC